MRAADLLEVLRHDSGPPLFYCLEKPLVLVGETVGSDWLSRILPFAATVLLFAAAAWLDRGGGREWFLLLLACSPLLLVYAAEARAYALLALLIFAVFLLLFHGQPSVPRLAAGAAAIALALWTHYLALFFFAAAAVLLAVRRRWGPLLALTFGAIPFVAWTPILFRQPREATAWMREPFASSLMSFLAVLGGTGRIPNSLGGPLPAPFLWIGAGAGLLLLISIALGWRDADRESTDAMILTALTMAFIFAASFVRPVAFPGRSEMTILPIWLWAVSRAAAERQFPRMAALAAVVLAGTSSVIVLTAPRRQPVPAQAVDLVVHTARAEDQVIAAAAFYLPARLARDRGELAAPLMAFPPDLALHPGWVAARLPTDADYRTMEIALSRLGPGGRAFVLLHPLLRTQRLDALLASRGSVHTLMTTPDALVLLCTARESVPSSLRFLAQDPPIPSFFRAIAKSDIP